jgi:hypothetical protein
MTTKPPSSVEPAPAGSLEGIAYGCVQGLPASDPHDLDRLGYALWLWLKKGKDPLKAALKNAGAHLMIDDAEALERISAKLAEKGITL